MRIIIALALLTIGTLANAAILTSQYDSVVVGNTIINNNIWNSPSGSQQVTTYANGSWVVNFTTFNLPTNGAPGSYPNSQQGCHWGTCSPLNPMPKQVSALQFAQVNWTTASTTNIPGTYNKSLDIWFNTTPTTSTSANGQELMIWTERKGNVVPVGSYVGRFTYAKTTYEVWHGGIVTTYLRVAGGYPFIYDLRVFINNAVARGYINPAWYLITVQAGFEIWNGGAGLSTSTFTTSIY